MSLPASLLAPCLATLAFASAATSVLAQSVLVVDQALAAGADHATITAAIAAASDGDTLLVRPGSYFEIVIVNDRELTIVADGPPGSVSFDGLTVTDLAPTKHVVLRGCEIRSTIFLLTPTVELRNCDGPILVEHCSVFGGSPLESTIVDIDDCRAVTFSGCVVVPPASSAPTRASVVVEDSSLALVASQVFGTNGQPPFGAPGQATSAMVVFDSRVSISASSLLGGNGANGFGGGPSCQNGAPGAPALVVDGTGASDVELIDTVLVAGIGGAPSSAPCAPGATPSNLVANPGAGGVSLSSAVAPTFVLTSPLRSGQLLDFELTGPPNAQVLLLLGFEPGLVNPYDPVLVGVGVVGAPELVLPYFPIPPDGSLDDTDAPGTIALPPGFTHLNLVLQHVVADPIAGLVASTPASLLVLDPAY